MEIHWPDSPLFIGLLLGFLSYLSRGRAWDGATGSIKDAQEIGRQIFALNYGLRPCGGMPGSPPGPPGSPPAGDYAGIAIATWAAAMAAMESEKMGVLDVKIEGGKLWKRMAPCCEWFEVGELLLDPDLGDDPVGDVVEASGEGYDACGKAYAVIDTLYAVSDAIWDASTDMPWQYCANVQDRFPSLSVSCGYIIQSILQIPIMAALGHSYETVHDETSRQVVLCRLAKIFNNDAEGMTQSNWDYLQGAFVAEFAPDVANYWMYVMLAVGKGDLNNLALLGAADTSRDCGCPASPYHDQYSDPNEDGWYLTDPLDTLVIDSTGSSDWTNTCRTHAIDRKVYGCVFEVFHEPSGPGDLKQMNKSQVCAATEGYSIWDNTSGNTDSNPRVCSGHTDVLDSLFGAGNYLQRNGGESWSDTTPRFNTPHIAVEAWQLGYNEDDYAEIRGFRWIANSGDE